MTGSTGDGSSGGTPAPEAFEDALRPTARAAGGDVRVRGARGGHDIELVGSRWIVTLECVWAEQSWSTVVRAPFRGRGGPRFAVRSQRMFDDLWKRLGFLQDVEVGDGAFDWRFLVQGSDPAATRAVLDEEVRRRLIELVPIDLRVYDPTLTGRARRDGPGVEEVRLREPGVVGNPARVVGLFELTLELLERLAPDGPGFAGDPEALMARLEMPRSGAAPWAPGLYGDGRLMVSAAARRLGELGAAASARPGARHCPLTRRGPSRRWARAQRYGLSPPRSGGSRGHRSA